jgi:hypothetical protein
MTPQSPDETRSSVAAFVVLESLHTVASGFVGSGFWSRILFADEVDWPLDEQCMPFFSSLDYDRNADHLSGCGDVNQEGFSAAGGTKMSALVRSAFKFSRASSASGV